MTTMDYGQDFAQHRHIESNSELNSYSYLQQSVSQILKDEAIMAASLEPIPNKKSSAPAKQPKSTSISGASTQTQLLEQKIDLRRQILQKFRAGFTLREESKTKALEQPEEEKKEHPQSNQQMRAKQGKSKARKLLDKGIDSSQTESLADSDISKSFSSKSDHNDF